MRKLQIAVIGYNEDRCTREARLLAYQVGSEIAQAGAVLICGGLGGVMESACKGAKDKNGFTVGIIPQDDFLFANEFCDVVICTGMGFARDFVTANSADGIIAVGGGVGTLIEMAVGYMKKKVIVAVQGSGGVSDNYAGKYLDERNRVPILIAKDAYSAVQIFSRGKNHLSS